ncbi:unnamed protein product, partial [Rotaria sp. Silwood2]
MELFLTDDFSPTDSSIVHTLECVVFDEEIDNNDDDKIDNNDDHKIDNPYINNNNHDEHGFDNETYDHPHNVITESILSCDEDAYEEILRYHRGEADRANVSIDSDPISYTMSDDGEAEPTIELEITKYICEANLDKSKTKNLLLLLQHLHDHQIPPPPSTKSLWNKLNIKFEYLTIGYCTH